MAKPASERMMKIETDITYIKEAIDMFRQDFVRLEKKLASQNNLYAAKWVETAVKGVVLLTLTAVMTALLSLVIL